MKTLDDFIKNEKKYNRREKTIENYVSDIKAFLKYKKLNNIEDLKNIDMNKALNDYKKKLIKEGYKARSINRKLISINQIIKFLEIKDCKIKTLKIQKQIMLDDVISKNEILRLLDACENERDRAIIITLYYTGVRVSELLEITIKDINKDKIAIEGKGGKYRDILIGYNVKQAWNKYMKVRNSKEEQLFIGQRGPLTRQGINYILHKYYIRARVKKKKLHPHNFRHAFCKALADKGIGIDVIADLAGHESLETTRIYTKRTRKELVNVIDEL